MSVNDAGNVAPQLANHVSYWSGWNKSNADVSAVVDVFKSEVAHPLLNGVLRTSTLEDIESTIASTRDHFAELPWIWRVGTDSAAGTGEALLNAGAMRVGTMPVMAVRLADVTAPALPSGYAVELVDDAGLDEWVSVYAPPSGIGTELEAGCVERERQMPAQTSIVRVLVRIDGEAVATALLHDSHGVAGIYVVATSEGHRRKGIGAAVTAAALREGQARGLVIGTLQSSDMGMGVYRRMGFDTVAEYALYAF